MVKSISVSHKSQLQESLNSIDSIPIVTDKCESNISSIERYEMELEQFNTAKSHSSGLVRLYRKITNLIYLIPSTPSTLKELYRLDRKGVIGTSWNEVWVYLLGKSSLSILNNQDPKHKQLRNLLNPFFMNNEGLRDRFQIIQFYVKEFMNSLCHETDEYDEYIKILPKARKFAFDVIFGIIFGNDIFSEELSQKMLNDFKYFWSGFGDLNVYHLNKSDTLLGQGMIHRAILLNDIEILIKQCLDLYENGTLDKTTIIYKMIDTKMFGSDYNDLTDFKENILGLIFAGFDTTASTICNLLYCRDVFAANPFMVKMEDELKENCKELNNFDFVANNATLDGFVKEVLRFIPTVATTPKQFRKDEEIGGYLVEKDTNIMIHHYIIAKNECIFGGNADIFDPMRFIDHPPGKQVWYPFGLGSKMCLGSKLVFLELKIITCFLFNNYQFKLDHNGLEKSQTSPFNFYDIHGKFYEKDS